METHSQQGRSVPRMAETTVVRQCGIGEQDGLQIRTTSGQLIFSSNGLLIVHSDSDHWLVPPTMVLRLLPDAAYRVSKGDQVCMQRIKLSDDLSDQLALENGLYRLTPLLRELLEALAISARTRLSHKKKATLLIELLNQAGVWKDKVSLRCLGEPNDARVAYICNYVYENLDSPKTLQKWAFELKHDTRTLHRLFVQEFGLPFVQWRQQTRLLAALGWLAEGRQVMHIALDLGYQSQSAFAAMFRRNMGMTPSEWQDSQSSVLASRRLSIMPCAPF